MLVFSAIVSLGLMAFTFVNYKREGSSILMAILFSAGSGLLGLCLFLPTLLLHAVLVILALGLWKWQQWPARSLLAFMALAAVATYGFFGFLAMEQIAEYHRLRKQYAFESMEERLPAPKNHASTKLSNESESHLIQLEKNIRSESNDFRIKMLEQLHQESVQNFITSPGFGVGRRIQPTERTLEINLDHDGTPIPQPVPSPSSIYPEDDLREPIDVNPDPLRVLHLESVINFANPRGFGLVISRQKVAGFQSHQFNTVPNAKQWKIQTLELIGLLMHKDPVIYISDELPLMEKLRNVPTRPLNVFEAAGIKRLQEGHDLFVRDANDTIRMLGAVRSIEQCVKCHGGERGDLLGAFSYRLQRVL